MVRLQGRTALTAIVGLLLLLVVLFSQLPALGAGGLLHPARRTVDADPPAGCRNSTLAGDGVALAAWDCRAAGVRRGTVVYLHGVADNRTSGAGVVARFTKLGFDVLAYDSRAHGESEGDACTYGYFEARDLQRVLEAVEVDPIVLIGVSLGAAVALQQAAGEPRVAAVIAAESFADLRSVAVERAPFFFTPGIIRRAFALAEQQADFVVDAVSPVLAATRIQVPVLLVHGVLDSETPADHSRRVFSALAGPKRLILVDGAGHNGSLRAEVWPEIDGWLDAVLSPGAAPTSSPGAPR